MQVNSPGRLTPSKRNNDDDGYVSDDYASVIDLFDPYRPHRQPELKRVKREQELVAIPFAITPPPTIHIPLLPSLYHLATSAHTASAQHLQQVFIPLDTRLPPTGDIAPIKARPDSLYESDSAALDKATALLIFALDALRTGLATKGISEKERVAFSIEFGHVAVKLLRTGQTTIDSQRIHQDAREAVGVALSISRRLSYMRASTQQLEILDAKLQATDGRKSYAARLIRQALVNTPTSEHTHRYTLRLLFVDIAAPNPTEALAMLDSLESEARTNGHIAIVQLAALARLRLLFHERHWLDVPDSLSAITLAETGTWVTHLRLHHILYQALWLGRSGDDAATRVCLKQTYELMDLYISDDAVKQLKHTGGRFELHYAPCHSLMVQLTPPNVLFAMTYLATSVCRRDYLGSHLVAKCLIMPQMLQETAHLARADDLWDLNFSPSHGPAHALAIQRDISSMRVEIMLEHVTALMYRCDNAQAEQVFSCAVHLAHKHSSFPSLAPHFCLVHAQFAHLLGRDQAALRSYRACSSLVTPGSEFASIVEICTLACAGAFVTNTYTEQMQLWVQRCRPSSYACLSAAAHLVASFIDPNRVSAKRKINNAYEISVKAGYNIIRLLVFTLTTSIHMFGNEDTRVRQLVSGVDSAKLMGGKGTHDEVGQLITGLWFAEKLKEHYRREKNAEAHAAIKLVQQRHLKRLNDQTNQVTSIPCNS